jgi:hypothetical protein
MAEGLARRVYDAKQRHAAALVRDLFGNPFVGPPALPPGLLPWRGGLVEPLTDFLLAGGQVPDL